MPILIRYVLILSALVLAGCYGDEEAPADPGPATGQEPEKQPDQESWESTIPISRDGNPVAVVWASYLAHYIDESKVYLRDSVHVDFYDREGRHNSVLTSEAGVIDEKRNSLVATGNVVVVSDSGIVLRTEELRWDNQNQKIVSDVAVLFTTADDTLVGDSFRSDPDLKNYEIRNARGVSRRALPLEPR